MDTLTELPVALQRLINAWCDRRELGALAKLLPAYTSYNGMTDGLAMLRDAVRNTRAYANGRLPQDEEATLELAVRLLDRAFNPNG